MTQPERRPRRLPGRLLGRRLRRWVRQAIPPISAMVVVLLLVLLYLVSDSLRAVEQPEGLYLALLGVSAVGLLFLALVVLWHIVRLIRHYRRGRPGARLTARLVLTFVALSVVPVVIVFYFSLTFVQRGIDSWFDVQVEQAMTDALSLSQKAFDGRMRQALEETRRAADELRADSSELIALSLSQVRRTTSAQEMTILGQRNLIIASSSEDATSIVPARADEGALAHARSGRDFIGLVPGDDGLQIRVVVPMEAGLTSDGGKRVLQALFDVPDDTNALSSSVQAAYNDYRELVYLHASLKQTFTLALTLALLLSLLTAVWLAFLAAGRLLSPIRELAAGTRAVAEGDYSLRLPVDRRDDLGQLVQSFNTMTARVRRAHEVMRELQELADKERDYLDTVIQHLSSGVLTLTHDGRIISGNSAAQQILGVNHAELFAGTLQDICREHAGLQPLCEAFFDHLGPQQGLPPGETIEAQLRIMNSLGRKVLLARLAALPPDGEMDAGGYVMVLEDVTALIQAQRDAAWSEVARRLAHEIKNPLTPIGLSAERLRRRILPQLDQEHAPILDRATATIIAQVDAMKQMVNEFADYAHSPRSQPVRLDLRALAAETVELYRGSTAVKVRFLAEGEQPVWVEGDATRLRQLLHNLIRNASQALHEDGTTEAPTVLVGLRLIGEAGQRLAELTVADNGPGFPAELLERLFEPYVTTRPKGTGLGLAIVKKIVDEHAGVVHAWNAVEQPQTDETELGRRLANRGARVTICLPLESGQLPVAR
ncbi:MAG: ATP-binding protein [Halothiobacillaceae bacterium]